MHVFEKDADGLLHEVPPARVETVMAGRRKSQRTMTCLVLFTPQEEAERDAADAAARAEIEAVAQQAARDAAAQDEAERARIAARTPEEKLAALGLTREDLKALLS
jgi:hypothetical protein